MISIIDTSVGSRKGRYVNLGSIPARAGEPHVASRRESSTAVYPRACGGTARTKQSLASSNGLSPRVRGNPLPMPFVNGGNRSIPARAGEPARRARPAPACRVYPRACGGTGYTDYSEKALTGLSPRVRGNRVQPSRLLGLVGSIPARAGEPRPVVSQPDRCRVYPRACGGTVLRDPPANERDGLSPRVRGNRARRTDRAVLDGSIPARAGEPRTATGQRAPGTVYPRACGGTPLRQSPARRLQGLSPRVRGNLHVALVLAFLFGSIPARAGEPPRSPLSLFDKRVYPRACGGTGCAADPQYLPQGLSPRVRGNRSGHY